MPLSKLDEITLAALYRAVWRVTAGQQIMVIALSIIVAALAAVPLKFQEMIINHLTYEGDIRGLIWLCAGMIGVVLVSLTLKWALNFRLAILGESVIRRIRQRLVITTSEDVARGETPTVDSGTLVTMLSVEAESVGAFAGSAFSAPVLQAGTLLSVFAYIVVSEPWLGLIAGLVSIPQALIVIGKQKLINACVRDRVTCLRHAASLVTAEHLEAERDALLADFDEIYDHRQKIFLLKLSSKFAISLISALGSVSILFLGGVLALNGKIDIGVVVASLSGLSRIDGPWRELLGFFRSANIVKVNYAMIVDQLRIDDTLARTN